MIAHQNLLDASRGISSLLTERRLKLGMAESFTGGLISSSITMIEGASNYFSEGIVCYSVQSKMARLGVKKNTIESFGAVSCACLREMLLGLIKDGADVAIATTGNAGPTTQNGNSGVCFVGAATNDRLIIQKTFTDGTRADVIKNGALRAINCAIALVSGDDNGDQGQY